MVGKGRGRGVVGKGRSRGRRGEVVLYECSNSLHNI